MKALIGFDPGGKGTGEGSFGWAVLEDAEALPLRLLAGGLARHAEDALERVAVFLEGSRAEIFGIGIDAPLTWVSAGRRVDAKIGAQQINSLWGACLVQGWLVAKLAEECFPDIPLTESHPKMVLQRRFQEMTKSVAKAVNSSLLQTLVSGHFDSPHIRDAALQSNKSTIPTIAPLVTASGSSPYSAMSARFSFLAA
jgi:hypothetical protein